MVVGARAEQLDARRERSSVETAVEAFIDVLDADRVITDPTRLRTYECDGLTTYRVTPAVVVLPETTEEVAAVVVICHRLRLPLVARGAGTGLSGGAVPVYGGVVIGLAGCGACSPWTPSTTG